MSKLSLKIGNKSLTVGLVGKTPRTFKLPCDVYKVTIPQHNKHWKLTTVWGEDNRGNKIRIQIRVHEFPTLTRIYIDVTGFKIGQRQYSLEYKVE